jgi:cyclophilin family peptidyl-prolyl cis-trans isomerase
MLKQLSAAAAILLAIQSGVVAQTMRFTTNVGSFDMVLNPENDPSLQPVVDNIVAYIGLGRYHFSAVNRAADGATPAADDDFVLQMGGFMGFPPVPELWADLHTPIEKLNDGVVVDANGDGNVDFNALSNTRGTVSLALSAGNPNSGTSSFFVNLGSNTFLDSQGFVPFARIENMATIDRIMQLMQTDLSDEVGEPGSLTYIDVPLTDMGRLVVVKDVEVIEADADFSFVGPIASLWQLANRNSASAAALTASLEGESLEQLVASDSPLDDGVLSISPDDPAISAVPEPATVALGALGFFGALLAGRRRRGR